MRVESRRRVRRSGKRRNGDPPLRRLLRSHSRWASSSGRASPFSGSAAGLVGAPSASRCTAGSVASSTSGPPLGLISEVVTIGRLPQLIRSLNQTVKAISSSARTLNGETGGATADTLDLFTSVRRADSPTPARIVEEFRSSAAERRRREARSVPRRLPPPIPPEQGVPGQEGWSPRELSSVSSRGQADPPRGVGRVANYASRPYPATFSGTRRSGPRRQPTR